ncbi:MAG: hypothetical protein AAB074_00025 [Planctomycetota bacterium]
MPAASIPQAAALIEALASRRAIRTPWVKAAFEATHRHHFVPPAYRFPAPDGGLTEHAWNPAAPTEEDFGRIYADKVLVYKTSADGNESHVTLSEPGVNALVCEGLQLADGLRIMEIGGGLGFQAALFSGAGGTNEVTALEIDEESAARANRALAEFYPERPVRVVATDGWPGVAGAVFDRIVASVTCPDVSQAWIDQLAAGGRMLVPLAAAGWRGMLTLKRDGAQVKGRMVLPLGYLNLRGSHPATHGVQVPVSELAPCGKDALTREPLSPMNFAHHLVISLLGTCRGAGWFIAEDDVLKTGGFHPPAVRTVEPAGFAFLAPDALVWGGHPAAREILRGTLREWEILGKPAIPDFEAEILDRGAMRAGDPDALWLPLEEHALRWVLKPLPKPQAAAENSSGARTT